MFCKTKKYILQNVFKRNITNINRQKSISTNSHLITAPGKVSPIRTVPRHIKKPPYATNLFYSSPDFKDIFENIPIHNEESIQRMRESCKLARKVLDYCGGLIKPGITTEEIDRLAHEKIISEGAYPSPLLYNGYPKSICTSINNVICHGIPDDRPLLEGDIINIDVTVYLNGYHGDCSETYLVGNVEEKYKKLVAVSKLCRDAAISICGPGKSFTLIGSTISKIAYENGYSIPEDLVGHGIGKDFHITPFIIHSENNFEHTMQPGMIFTIEPAICEGRNDYHMWNDNWTILTNDGKYSSQFEHTILITENGHEILTQ